MIRLRLASLCFLAVALVPRPASATASAELYTSTAYHYGRFEARVSFAAGDGVVGSYFLWKSGSEQSGTFWNELDYEKVGADCQIKTNAMYGDAAGDHSQPASLGADACGAFHVYAYEWLPDTITWFVDGSQIRQETGDAAKAYADNAPDGMQLHFNVWPGNSSFGGNFSPSILPVHQYIDWVQFSSYENGAFTLAWREDFTASTVPSGWSTGTWDSPKNLSTHDPRNVNFLGGYAVLSLTADDATGPAGAMGAANGGMGGSAGSSGAGGATAGATSGSGAGGGSQAAGGTSPAAGRGSNPGGAGSTSTGSAGSSGGDDSGSGCGCRLAGSQGSAPRGALIGIAVGTALLGAARRRRRTPFRASATGRQR